MGVQTTQKQPPKSRREGADRRHHRRNERVHPRRAQAPPPNIGARFSAPIPRLSTQVATRYPLARLEPHCGYWQKEETVALKRTPAFSLRGSLSGKRVDGEVASTGGDDR